MIPLALMTLLAAGAWGTEISSATISAPHELVGTTIPVSSRLARLPVFPESLVYDVSWGIVAVGQATLGVRDVVEFNGQPAYHVISEARSNAFCDTFYKVRDLNESWIDAQNLTSLGYSKQLREGHFFRDEWVLYDKPAGGFLSKTLRRDGSFTWSAGTIPVQVQDILSSLYYVRAQELVPGAEVVVDVNTKRTWPLVIRVLRRETIRTGAGKFSCLLVEPALREEGIFIQKGRRLRIWLTDDERKIPVLMQVEVFFGHVTARLAKML
ncbi:MAG TPA: hypothetical protein DEB40_04250 [Elusimicrobia bacterium]|nr:hypothetical protein [Elusimicrobiota bacterium]HBT60937.1 hypothetical protein [Elusimicrobiota bacterium]